MSLASAPGVVYRPAQPANRKRPGGDADGDSPADILRCAAPAPWRCVSPLYPRSLQTPASQAALGPVPRLPIASPATAWQRPCLTLPFASSILITRAVLRLHPCASKSWTAKRLTEARHRGESTRCRASWIPSGKACRSIAARPLPSNLPSAPAASPATGFRLQGLCALNRNSGFDLRG